MAGRRSLTALAELCSVYAAAVLFVVCSCVLLCVDCCVCCSCVTRAGGGGSWWRPAHSLANQRRGKRCVTADVPFPNNLPK